MLVKCEVKEKASGGRAVMLMSYVEEALAKVFWELRVL